MAPPTILRIGCTFVKKAKKRDIEDRKDFILIRAEHDGPNALDFTLVGTDTADAFEVKINHADIEDLKASSARISEQEWESLLAFVFLGKVEEADSSITDVLETTAVVDPERSITITLQKRIQDITQKLGEIKLLPSEVEIDLPIWCRDVIESKLELQAEVKALRAKLAEKDDRITHFDGEMKEFTKLKNDGEDQLLEKFSQILNEKKLKIRDQQRLLASSTVDPAKLEEIEESRVGMKQRSPGPSSNLKRKGAEKDEDEESDGGFEKMDVDQVEEEEVVDEDQKTDSGSETEGESPPPPPNRKPAARPPPTNSPETSLPSRNSRGANTQPSSDDLPKNLTEPPPKRELPFKKKPPPKPVAPKEDSETESDDDEL